MRKSKFSETQIVGILKDAEAGVNVNDLLRTHGIRRAIFFKWRSEYGGASVSQSNLTTGSTAPKLTTDLWTHVARTLTRFIRRGDCRHGELDSARLCVAHQSTGPR